MHNDLFIVACLALFLAAAIAGEAESDRLAGVRH